MATTSNGGSAHLTQHLQIQSNQKNGSITITTCPTQISVTDIGCDKQADVETPLNSGEKDAQSTGCCTVNEKYDQRAIDQHAASADDKCQSSKTNASAGDGDNNGSTQDGHFSRELNFRNLKLQCMCSDDEVTVITKSNVDPTSNQTSADDETEIEISEVEAVTEIGESIFENHRCTHCGRDHCCFFLRCCYCLASSGLKDSAAATMDANTNANTVTEAIANANAGTLHETNPCQSECDVNRKVNSNNIPNVLPLDSCTGIGSNQNLASKLCDEYCKIIRNTHRTGQCSSAAAALIAKKQCCEEAIDGNDKHSTVTKSITIGCHCRWYCIQDCDSDAKAIKPAAAFADNRQKCDSTLAVQEPEIVSPIVNELPLNDENRLRCCRCSKELI